MFNLRFVVQIEFICSAYVWVSSSQLGQGPLFHMPCRGWCGVMGEGKWVRSEIDLTGGFSNHIHSLHPSHPWNLCCRESSLVDDVNSKKQGGNRKTSLNRILDDFRFYPWLLSSVLWFFMAASGSLTSACHPYPHWPCALTDQATFYPDLVFHTAPIWLFTTSLF